MDDDLKALAKDMAMMLIYVKEVGDLEETIQLLDHVVSRMLREVEDCALFIQGCARDGLFSELCDRFQFPSVSTSFRTSY